MSFGPRATLSWVIILVSGCATSEEVKAPALLERLSSSYNGLGPNAVYLEIAHIRQPVGDRYLNHELWDAVDEQVLPLEQRPLVEANGFRVGTISGSPPQRLQDLLTAERSCKAHRVAVRSGSPLFIPLGVDARTIMLKVFSEDDQLLESRFEKAQVGLSVLAIPEPDGGIHLKIQPRIRHGDRRLLPQPAWDQGSWSLNPKQLEETYPQLEWQLTLSANECLVLGGQVAAEHTLGHCGFVQTDPDKAKQDLLLLRFVASAAAPEKVAAAAYSDAASKSSLPLALQSIAKTSPTSRAGR